jgi:hypothetical protein
MVPFSILNTPYRCRSKEILTSRRQIAIAAIAALISADGFQPSAASVSSKRHVAEICLPVPATKLDGYAPVKISIQDNYGYLVEPGPGIPIGFVLPENSCLLSVDGHSLFDKSWPEVKLLLAGPVGSTATLEFLTANGEVTKRSLLRTTNHTEEERKITPTKFAETLKAIGLGESANWDSGEIDQNMDVFARASARQAVEKALSAPVIPEDSNLVITTALAALLDMQEIGEMAEADRYLKIVFNDKARKTRHTFNCDDVMLAVSNLNYCGRQSEALRLALMYLDTQDWKDSSPDLDSWDATYQFSFLHSVSQVDLALKNARIQTLAKRVQAQYLATPARLTWLGKYFERSGQAAIAETVYRTQSNCWLRKIERSSALELSDLQATTEALYSGAVLAARQGNYPKAATILESALTLVQERAKAPLEKRLVTAPLYFPKPADITLALANVRKHQPVPQVPESWMEISARRNFATINQFYNAVAAKDLKKAESASHTLLVHYLNSPYKVSADQGFRMYSPSRGHRLRTRQNLYLMNMTIARKWADVGEFRLSNNIIHSLHRSLKSKQNDQDSMKAQELFLNAEIVFNQSRDPSRSANSVTEPLNWRLPVRLLAMCYHYAGEPLRAQFFINQALVRARASSGAKTNEKAESSQLINEFAMLHLDAACILAAARNYDEAQKHFQQSVKLSPSLSEEFTGTGVALAYIYEQQGHTAKAFQILDRLQQKGQLATDFALLKRAYLLRAKLHFQNREWKSALAAATSALASKKLYSIEPYYIAGKSAEQLGDFALAARLYFDAPGYCSDSGLPSYQPSVGAYFEDAAAAVRSKPITKNKEELIAICLKKADGFSTDSYTALILSEQALALMDDDDRRKPDLLVSVCELKTAMEQSANVRADCLSLSKKAAELARRLQLSNQSKYWLTLACYEADSSQLDAAIEHGRLAISLYDKNDPAFMHIQQIIPPFGLAFLLKKNGGTIQAEQLLQEAVERVNSLAGAGSLESQAQMACQFEFYLQDKNFARANEVLKQILGGKYCHQPLVALKSLEPDYQRDPENYLPGNPILRSSEQIYSDICYMLIDSVRSNDCEFAQTALKQILHKLETEQPSAYRALASTWGAIAKTYVRAGATASAYDAYQKQFSLCEKFIPNASKSDIGRGEFFELLRTMDRQDELEALEREREISHAESSAKSTAEWRDREAIEKAKVDAEKKAVKW